ncbi:MAG: helix-turn-helix domain-containing protein [Pseudomonadota bacterium]
MLLIDGLFRFSGVGLLLFLAVVAARSWPNSKGKPFLVLACASVAALFLGYTPPVFEPSYPLHAVIRFLDVPHLVFVWLFGLSLFQSDFNLRPFHVVVGIAYCLPILCARFVQFGVMDEFPFWMMVMVDVMALGIAIHLIASALLGRGDDLLPDRRSARVYFAAMIAFVTISAAAIEVIFVGEIASLLPTAKVAVIWPAIVWACFWLLSAKTGALDFKVQAPSSQPKNDEDQALNAALMELMVKEQAFLNPELTIVEVAKKLAVSQHRLRHHINQHLGYTNFSSFINEHRIKAVKHAFNDTESEALSITSIALSNGFKSLSSFNRAFKVHTGQTPREYRQKQAKRAD